MRNKLDRFLRKLGEEWKGSLVSVKEAERVQPDAKTYLSRLAHKGLIERVTWGWYWIPDTYKDFFDFLVKDRHFKVLQKQTAAAVWNGDFIHRDHYSVAVTEVACGRALEKFATSRGWHVSVEARDLKEGNYTRMGKLYVESLEDTIVDCVKEWAFADALAAIKENETRVNWDKISEHYWERIPRTDTRIGQVLKYGTDIIGREAGSDYGRSKARITDAFVRRQVEEAAERVAELV